MTSSRSPAAGSARAPSGIINVLKPVGMTSHDVVDAVRKMARLKRVGHTGTLDPGAAGVLVLALGQATRIAEFIAAFDKEYRVEVVFGRATDSGDAYGRVVLETEATRVSRGRLEEILPQFTGTISQVPPMASAVRSGGRRLYEYARRGETVDVAPRQVRVHRLEVREWIEGTPTRAWLHIVCSKGTYIRRLCHDIGLVLSCGALAIFMLRTRVGGYTLKDARTLEELQAMTEAGTLELALQPPDDALGSLPAVDLSAPQRQAVLQGQPIPLFKVASWQRLMEAPAIRLRDSQGLIAIARVEAGTLKPFKVLRGT